MLIFMQRRRNNDYHNDYNHNHNNNDHYNNRRPVREYDDRVLHDY